VCSGAAVADPRSGVSSGDEVDRGVAGGRECERLVGLREVGEKAAGLGGVADDGQRAQAPVASGTVEDVDVVAPSQQSGPVCAGTGHHEQAVEQARTTRCRALFSGSRRA